MSTNAPTSRHIMYMHCHVDGVSLEVIFFPNKYFNRKFPIFLQIKNKNISFPLFFKLHFVFLLALHFECSSNSFAFLLYTFNPLPISHPYIHYIYKLDNSWETWLELFQRALLIFRCSSTQLEKLDLKSPREIFTSLNL